MRFLKVGLLFAFLFAVVGCGGGDLNKDLKPASKDAPKPSAVGAGGAGGASVAPPGGAPK